MSCVWCARGRLSPEVLRLPLLLPPGVSRPLRTQHMSAHTRQALGEYSCMPASRVCEGMVGEGSVVMLV